MKCFRVKLSDRRDVAVSAAARRGSPRHYCQRRLANSFLDEQEWLKRYTPERYHLESYCREDDDDDDSRPVTPSSGRESEIFKISTTKNVFCPAFLTINNLDFPVDAPPSNASELKTWSKKRVRYKMVPKNCSANLHRMFVKSELVVEEMSRASSRASTDYDEYEYEDYLKEYCDDSLESSEEEEEVPDETASNNNDSNFGNKNDFPSTDSSKICQTSEYSNQVRNKEFNPEVQRVTPHKREKRKSLTLSRIPSPETVQVIRIDVITGYPVSSDNSVLSEATENDKTISEGDSNISFIKPIVYQKEIHLHSLGTQTDIVEAEQSDFNNIRTRYYIENERLLNCRSVNLTDRAMNNINKL